MAKKIEATGKTIDDAIENGLKELNVEREDVTVEVLENPKSGFLGIGASPAKVLVTLLSEEEDIVTDTNYDRWSDNGGAVTAVKAPKKAPKAPKKEESKNEEPKKDRKEADEKDFEKAEDFLKNVLSFINSDADIKRCENADGNVALEIVGENLGGIIGRRGETLDALQHLANLVCNRKSEQKVRVSLDAENYREKRSAALEKFALRAAAQAKKYKRNKALEPMNAYERHIIHVALQDMENISTSSVGVEPNRRVVINYTGPDARPPRRRYESR